MTADENALPWPKSDKGKDEVCAKCQNKTLRYIEFKRGDIQ